METYDLTPIPPANSCKRIDYDKIDIVPGIINGTFFLVVSGTKPCVNMQVRLSPVVYAKCPEFWEIEVTLCGSGICLPATAPFSECIPLACITGSMGILVNGATKSEKFEVKGGCN